VWVRARGKLRAARLRGVGRANQDPFRAFEGYLRSEVGPLCVDAGSTRAVLGGPCANEMRSRAFQRPTRAEIGLSRALLRRVAG